MDYDSGRAPLAQIFVVRQVSVIDVQMCVEKMLTK